MKVPAGFDPIPINRASSYKVNQTESYSSSDIDVVLGLDINSGFIEPNQNFQQCYDSIFNLLGDSIDKVQNWDMKVPSGFDQIHKNWNNLAQGIRVKTQSYEIPPKFSSNLLLPQSLYGNLSKSLHSGYPKNLDVIYQLGYEYEKPDLLPFYTCKGLNGHNLVFSIYSKCNTQKCGCNI